MSGFVEVLGKHHFYTLDLLMYLKIEAIHKIYPFYGEKDANTETLYWRCVPEHPNGVFLGYELVDFAGDKYICFDKNELQKIGINNPHLTNKIPIGFVVKDPQTKK